MTLCVGLGGASWPRWELKRSAEASSPAKDVVKASASPKGINSSRAEGAERKLESLSLLLFDLPGLFIKSPKRLVLFRLS